MKSTIPVSEHFSGWALEIRAQKLQIKNQFLLLLVSNQKVGDGIESEYIKIKNS